MPRSAVRRACGVAALLLWSVILPFTISLFWWHPAHPLPVALSHLLATTAAVGASVVWWFTRPGEAIEQAYRLGIGVGRHEGWWEGYEAGLDEKRTIHLIQRQCDKQVVGGRPRGLS